MLENKSDIAFTDVMIKICDSLYTGEPNNKN